MKILAFETALRECSVALSIDGVEVGYIKSNSLSQQSEELFVHIEHLLEMNQITLTDIDIVAVNIGPGSFTGVRIGVAAAKGLKLVLPQLKMIGITSMEILAANSLDSEPAIVILESGQAEYYCQIRGGVENVNRQQLIDLIKENPLAKIISHCELDFVENVELAEINASVLLKIATKRDVTENDITPFYIKSPSISLPKSH